LFFMQVFLSLNVCFSILSTACASMRMHWIPYASALQLVPLCFILNCWATNLNRLCFILNRWATNLNRAPGVVAHSFAFASVR
jgi:hypothetical protein